MNVYFSLLWRVYQLDVCGLRLLALNYPTGLVICAKTYIYFRSSVVDWPGPTGQNPVDGERVSRVP